MIYRPKIYSYWGLSSNFEYEKQIEIFVDQIPNILPNPNVIIIILIQESFNTQELVKFIQNNKHLYDFVFTWIEEILNTNEKAVKFLGINTWISNYSFPVKEYGVSTLVGGKTFMIGHRTRQILWERQHEINVPKKFFLSSHYKYNFGNYSNNLILGEKKEPLFDTMFHIVIENESVNNMFTEKLIDCFQTKTIPIYWGAPNIEEYFNIEGMLIPNSMNQIIELSNSITPELYYSKKEAIEDNYNRSMNYLSHTQILDKKLNELFK
jgi:hypothetical protein